MQRMDPFGFTSEEEGIRIAKRALGELRVFLRTTAGNVGRTAPRSPRVPSIIVTSDDQDMALYEQFNDLVKMLRVVSDAQFARTLIGGGNERAAIGGADNGGNMDLLRVIVMTARDILAFQTHDGFNGGDDNRGGGSAGSSRSAIVDNHLARRESLRPLGDYLRRASESVSPISSCTVCAEELLSQPIARLETSCGHSYCSTCAISLVESYISQRFPPGPLRCCPAPQPPIPPRLVYQFINEATRGILEEKLVEADTPYDQRLYCPQEACRKFIDPAKVTPTVRVSGHVMCPNTTCGVNICLECKQLSHQGVNCEKNADDLQAVSIQKRFGWGRCPGCGFVVEKIDGCNMVQCSRCGRRFSYQPLHVSRTILIFLSAYFLLVSLYVYLIKS